MGLGLVLTCEHHGAPTRLLDWSDGPLIALHFALKNKKDGDSNDAIVYVMQPHRLRLYLLALEERKMTSGSGKTTSGAKNFTKAGKMNGNTPICPLLTRLSLLEEETDYFLGEIARRGA